MHGTKRSGILRPAVALLAAGLAAPSARSQPAPEAPDTELDLAKLYRIPRAPAAMAFDGSFNRLAQRLVDFTGAQRSGDGYHARFELYEGQFVRFPADEETGRTDLGKWVFKLRGRVEVIGNGRRWIPREGDAQENVKELDVKTARGKPRSISFRFEVHASESKREGKNEVVTVLGHEEVVLQLIEHPEDKLLRLVLDPSTFLKHQKGLTSNWVEEEGKGSKPEKSPKKKKEDDAGEKGEVGKPRVRLVEAGADDGPRAQVTLVRSFKANENEIVVGFRRKWAGCGDQVVDGVLRIQLDSTLSTTLFYEVPKKTGKPTKVQAAHFAGGHQIQ